MTMARHLNCSDVGFDCSAQFDGETEDDVMVQVAEHARTVHAMSDSDLQEHDGAIRGAITDA
jgi:predicted small metal-binding protein